MKQETKQNIKDWAQLTFVAIVVFAMVNNLKSRVATGVENLQPAKTVRAADSVRVAKSDSVAADTVARYALHTARQLKR